MAVRRGRLENSKTTATLLTDGFGLLSVLSAVRGESVPHRREARIAAEFHGVPAPYLAKHLQQLSRAGILEAVPGPRGGYRLACPPEKISLLSLVEATDGTDPCFRCKEIRQRGPSGVAASAYKKPCGIARAMWRAEKAWRDEMKKVSVAKILQGMQRDIHPHQMTKTQQWLTEAIR